jgi:hypothetical protein
MIEFRKNGQPVRVNRKCAGCAESCKQHDAIKIIRCLNWINKKTLVNATAV